MASKMKSENNKGSDKGKIRNVRCANHFVETSYAENVNVASYSPFSPELLQHSQPPDQEPFRPFRNICHKQLVRKAISVIDYKFFHAAFIKVLVLNVLHYVVELWCCAMCVAVVNYF
jgi:hypothetical protein